MIRRPPRETPSSDRCEYKMRRFTRTARAPEWNMKERLLIITAIGLLLGTGAFAQSPSERPKTDSPPAAQSQTNPNSSAPPASSSTSSQSSAPSAQDAQSASSDKSTTTTNQSSPNTAGTNSQAQSNRASPPSQGAVDDGSFAGSISPAAELALSGADQSADK